MKRELSKNCKDFINDQVIEDLVAETVENAVLVREIIAKSLNKEALTVAETAALLAVKNRELLEEIYDAARTLKKNVYGNRIVIFAPLYTGNLCENDCGYCVAGHTVFARNQQMDEGLIDALRSNTPLRFEWPTMPNTLRRRSVRG